jgi:hypothetical protein
MVADDDSNDTTSVSVEVQRQQVLIQELPGHDTRHGVYLLQDDICMAQILAIRPEKVQQCTQNEYCPDTMDTLLPAMTRVTQEHPQMIQIPPTLAQFGDSGTVRGYNSNTKEWDPFPSIPHIMKFRLAFADRNALAAMTASDCIATERPMYPSLNNDFYHYQPIVWKLTSLRHFSMIPSISAFDIPYEQKKDMAVFRGALTGIYRDGYKLHLKGKLSDEEKCLLIHRCRLVYTNAHSKLVDARLVQAKRQDRNHEIPPSIGGVEIYGSKYKYEQMLQYKAIIMVEGNDISSGFKWALYSNSVVLTQRPTKTSWALEELLEPWVHYVPLQDDLGDVPEKMQWILDNPVEAKRIADQGSLWIRDLMLHPDAATEEEAIYDEIVRRYRTHFVYTPSLGTNE